MKILAFDIGSFAVKAVELDVTFGRFELTDYFIERVTEASEQPPEEFVPGKEKDKKEEEKPDARKVISKSQVEAIRRILNARPFRYDRMCVNLPKGWVSMRLFQLPTRDRKAIQNSIQFELEDDIPFAIEDAINDFAILKTEGNSSAVLSALALHSDVSEIVSELQMHAIDPDMLTFDGWAFNQLFRRAYEIEHQNQVVCIVDIGASKTTVHILADHKPTLNHVVQCGGDDLTRAIANQYNLSFDDAEKAKVDGSFLVTQTHLDSGTPISEEQQVFSTTISDALFPALREIKQALMAFKSKYKAAPVAIYVTGGSSLIQNLPLYLEEQLGIQVYPLTYISKLVGQTLQLSETSEARIAVATGLSLSLVKIEKNQTINFRKDEFSKKGSFGTINWKAYQRPMQYIAVSLIFVYANLLVQWIILSSRLDKQQARVERAVKSVLGSVSPSSMNAYLSSPSTLKSAINKEMAKYKENQPVQIKPKVSAFDVLNKISASMPKDVSVDVNDFEIKDGKLHLTGVLDQLSQPDKLSKALESSKVLSEITTGKMEKDPKTAKTRFEFGAKVAEASNVKTR